MGPMDRARRASPVTPVPALVLGIAPHTMAGAALWRETTLEKVFETESAAGAARVAYEAVHFAKRKSLELAVVLGRGDERVERIFADALAEHGHRRRYVVRVYPAQWHRVLGEGLDFKGPVEWQGAAQGWCESFLGPKVALGLEVAEAAAIGYWGVFSVEVRQALGLRRLVSAEGGSS